VAYLECAKGLPRGFGDGSPQWDPGARGFGRQSPTEAEAVLLINA